MQVSIKNIYFRFEDEILDKSVSRKYSLGLKLKSFTIFTGDSNYEKIKTPDTSDKSENKLTYKVAKLTGLSLFCDWHEEHQLFDKSDFETLIKN